MYTEQDFIDIRRKLRRHRVALAIVLAALLAAYVFALARGVKGLAYAAAVLFGASATFGVLWSLLPCKRYLRFLNDMRQGGSHEFVGTLSDVSSQAEPQDGARVLPVHLVLDEPKDERTFYLNVSKAEGFPAPGTHVRLRCFGRHIMEAEVL